MGKDCLLSIRIPQGCQDWRGVESVPWILQLLEAGLTKKAIADHFGKTVPGLDKAIARYQSRKPASDKAGSTSPETGTSPNSIAQVSALPSEEALEGGTS